MRGCTSRRIVLRIKLKMEVLASRGVCMQAQKINNLLVRNVEILIERGSSCSLKFDVN